MRPAALALALLLASACDAEIDLEAEAAACADGAPLAIPGTGGHLVALNAYYLQEEAARALRRGEASSPFVEETLAKAAALGARVVRTNGFNDDAAKIGDSAIQIAPLIYDELALRALDVVLARAHAHGVRLVLPLGNFWDDYGGARQYVAWAGLDGPRTGDARFFTDERVVAHYAAHVAALLERVSTLDGIRYGDHPGVLAWELLNEPRAAVIGAAAMRAWVDRIGAIVKAHAPGQLVGTGEEGLDLDQFRLDAASPFVDIASVHLFPESWGASGDGVAAFGAHHLDTRIAEARALGKPVLVGEFGLRNDGLPLAERRAVYRGWFRCARRAGAGGEAPWMFAYDARPDEWDAFTFYWRDGTDPADAVNRYADVVADAAR